MNEVEQLQKRVQELENVVYMILASDRYIVQKHVQILDGKNIQVATGTGTKIGTVGGATGQKIGFFGATPVVQQTGVAVTAGGIHAALVNLGLITS